MITLVGFAIRLWNFDQSLFADELSTYWILKDHSLGQVLDSVASTDEITPPVYFVLGWLSVQLGGEPEWIRLPSLVAGTLAIPLVFLLGRRTIGTAGGVVAAAVMALSPFMIYYSTEGRSYAVMIALLVGSTLALLAALRTRRTRWWVIYAICTSGAIYSHYTTVFPLAAQFLWAAWFHREALRGLLLANLAALVSFLPWIPAFITDGDSPTTVILSALQPFTFDATLEALKNWAVGYPYLGTEAVPGALAVALIAAGVVIAAIAGMTRLARWARQSRSEVAEGLRRLPRGLVLVVLLLLSTPIGEALFSAVGTNLFGARNLNASWPGLALAIGALTTSAGAVLGTVCAGLVMAGLGIGAAKTVDPDVARPDYGAAAAAIQERWGPGDVVVDATTLTPVPLTGLDSYLPQTNPEFRLDLPVSDEPFTFGDPIPPADRLIEAAIEEARGGSLFLVTVGRGESELGATVTATQEKKRGLGERLLREAQPEFEIVDEATFSGLEPISVVQLQEGESNP